MDYDFHASGGMGKHGEGMVNPIRVVKLKGNKARVTSDLDRKQEAPVEERHHDNAAAGDDDYIPRVRKRPKPIRHRPKQPPSHFDELKPSSSSSGPLKIRDMTGKSSSTYAASSFSSSSSSRFPELLFNIHQLIHQTEQSIQKVDASIKSVQDDISKVSSQSSIIREDLDEQSLSISSVETVLSWIDDAYSSSDPYSSLYDVFIRIQQDHISIYHEYNLGDFAASLVDSCVPPSFRDFNPLTDDCSPLVVFLTKW
eukprot:CAMPEP_0117423400 /NCGR_PEP_ID=MMETSP0758-20121206/4030_1 /TAXON_ID=63605 /ORGANISM="Percolomonas cosmopolitus, Strain AE-1 (ATCC 50343)" /LENGTH=254 /DNA_ID=CAMNT_0005206563 /DNA_START=164 /DNA_END=925 /DNA_ORIENTATION=+